MWELTTDNALDYLRRQGWVGPGPARVEELSGGVSNVVLRVVTATRTFVVKQSRPQLRTRDDWFSDVDRVYREQEVMEVLHPLLGRPVVPAVLHVDRPHYVFAMEHAPAGARVWKEALLAGEVDHSAAERAGRILGRMHEVTGRDPALVRAFADRKVFVQLRVDPFYRRVQERRPEVAAAVAPLIEDVTTRAEALCHGDFSPKNLLVSDEGMTLVDYETAHLGDPAMDLGFFFSHLLLKTVKHAPAGRTAEWFALTESAWRGYAAEVRFRPASELVRRGVGHLAVCLLARIDGTSPVDYLPAEPQREAVRNLGRSLLAQPPADWGEVLARVDRALQELRRGS
jgi:aminoglycoside phosphotransferase (APT) family kinase protein